MVNSKQLFMAVFYMCTYGSTEWQQNIIVVPRGRNMKTFVPSQIRSSNNFKCILSPRLMFLISPVLSTELKQQMYKPLNSQEGQGVMKLFWTEQERERGRTIGRQEKKERNRGQEEEREKGSG